MKNTVQLMDTLCNKMKMSGIYITANRSHDFLSAEFKKKKIDESKIYYIDAVTKGGGEKKGKCIFVDSPENLTEISLAISQLMGVIGSKNVFIVLDSISSLLVHNDKEAITKFIHFLSNRIREWDASGVLIISKGWEGNVGDRIMQFCDNVIQI